jgi:hypothetical protein
MLFNRRVHITKTTLDYLGDKFEVEAGNGSTRETYLADHKIETFLIVPPKVSRGEEKWIFFTVISTIINLMGCGRWREKSRGGKYFLNVKFLGSDF